MVKYTLTVIFLSVLTIAFSEHATHEITLNERKQLKIHVPVHNELDNKFIKKISMFFHEEKPSFIKVYLIDSTSSSKKEEYYDLGVIRVVLERRTIIRPILTMGYAYPNPSSNGSDSFVSYNLLKNTFDNVSAYRNINNIYNAGLSESDNTAVFLNLAGGEYEEGHSVELYRTETQNGVRRFYIIDRQNPNRSRWYSETEISDYIHSAFVIGDQDGVNQASNPLYQRQYNYNYNSIYSD